MLLANSCATIPDDPLCVDIRPGAGFCVTATSGKQFEIDDSHPYNGKTWYDMQLGMIKMPVDTWVHFKEYIIKECKKSNRCSKDITNWDRGTKVLDINH